MANHKSAAKRNRQRVKRTVVARGVRSKVRGLVKQARTAVEEGSDDADALVKQATSLLDRAGSKGVIPFKRTSRLISRLAQAQHKAKSSD